MAATVRAILLAVSSIWCSGVKVMQIKWNGMLFIFLLNLSIFLTTIALCYFALRAWLCNYRIFNLFWHDKSIILDVFATEIDSDQLIHSTRHVQFA